MATEQAAEKLSFKQLLGKATASQAAEELRLGRLWEGHWEGHEFYSCR